ncbi:MAG: hypothetical protein ACE5JX_21880, partial [Acidobacteriota bacterium]
MRARSLLALSFLLGTTCLIAQAPTEVEVLLAPGQSIGEESYFRASGRLLRNATGQMLFFASQCSQLPSQGPCMRSSNLFLFDEQGLRPLLNEETGPPGFSIGTVPTTIFLTDSGQILAAQRGGILRWEGGRFRWLVRQGEPAPDVSFQGLSLTFSEFRVSNRFAREDGSVVFTASLSNQASGVFEADGESVRPILLEGESLPGETNAIPAGALRQAGPVVAGSRAAFLSRAEGRGAQLLLHNGSGLRVIARRGQMLDGVLIDSLGAFDLNSAGETAFEVRFLREPGVPDSRMFLDRQGELVSLTRPGPLPGLVNLPVVGISGPIVTEFGEIYFGVTQTSGLGGIFCWRAGRLTKIALDGDAAPGGRTLNVTIGANISIPLPPFEPQPFQRMARPRTPGELAFQARLENEPGGLRTLIWRSGALEILGLNGRLLPESETHLVDEVSPIAADAAGSILLRASLCCGAFREALLLTGPARTSRRYLPYFAKGDFSAGWRPGPPGLGSPAFPISGLFFFDGETVYPMLETGDELTPDGSVSISQVAEFTADPQAMSPIRMNRRDQLAAFAQVQGRGLGGAFFLLENSTARPALLLGDSRLDPASPFESLGLSNNFGWNDLGELLFLGSLPDFSPGLWARRASGVLERVLLAGDRLDGSAGPEPILFRFPDRVWGLTNSGQGAFESFTEPLEASGTYLVRPAGFHQLWLPHVVSGRFGSLSFTSFLLAHNPGTTAATVDLDLFGASGIRIRELPSFRLEPGATRRLEMSFSEPGAGWARLQIRDGVIGASLRMAVYNPTELLSELTVSAVPAARSAFWRAGFTAHLGRDTGLAMVNTGNSDSEVTIERLGTGAIAQEVHRLQLPPGGYRAILLSELLDDLATGFRDDLYRITSQFPV